MIATNKLKVLTAVLAVCGLLAGGSVGFAQAADPPTKAKLGPTLDDKQFLTKTCETLRGSAPTSTEMGYFLADQDAGKRKKVITWLTEPEAKAEVLVFTASVDDTLKVFDLKYDLATQPPAASEFKAEVEVTPQTLTPLSRRLWLTEMQSQVTRLTFNPTGDVLVGTGPDETEEQFLTRVIESARGSKPTRIEKEYFLKDKDAKKREKLLDALLTDPAVAKKVGPEWK